MDQHHTDGYPPGERLLLREEVGDIFRVRPATVTRWVKAGKIPQDAVVRTLGGHARYRESHILALLSGENQGETS